MKTIVLTCIQCDSKFEYSVAVQQRHAELGFDPPHRCELCRRHKVRDYSFEPAGRWQRDKKRDYRLKYELQER